MTAPEPTNNEPAPKPSRALFRWLLPIVIVAALATLLCNEYLVTVFVVHGDSMAPTLEPGQRLVVHRRPAQIQRGDLVVFRNPYASDEFMVKRVLALPGERIAVRKGKLYVDDMERPETYVKVGTGILSLREELVPEGTYYLLGDNRAESVDSRAWGPIEAHLLLGRVLKSF